MTYTVLNLIDLSFLLIQHHGVIEVKMFLFQMVDTYIFIMNTGHTGWRHIGATYPLAFHSDAQVKEWW